MGGAVVWKWLEWGGKSARDTLYRVYLNNIEVRPGRQVHRQDQELHFVRRMCLYASLLSLVGQPERHILLCATTYRMAKSPFVLPLT